MRKRLALLVGVLVLILLVFIIFEKLSKTKKQSNDRNTYNVILISVDTLRTDHMGIYGYNKPTTPNIDKIFKDSLIFTNIRTVVPNTFQSFYTFFSGTNTVLTKKTLNNNSSVFLANSIKDVMLPKLLKDRKYLTAAFVTNPIIGVLGRDLFKRGFDKFFYYDHTNTAQYLSSENSFDESFTIFSDVFREDNINSQNVTMDANHWIDKHKGDKFFVWIHYTLPHQPYKPDSQFACSIESFFCNKEYLDKISNDPSLYSIDECNSPKSPEKEKILKSLYDAEILQTDNEIGKIYNHVENLGLDKNTIIVFYTDHGEGLENGMYGHGNTVYDSAVKIAFMIKHPNNNRRKEFSQSLDNTSIQKILLSLINFPRNEKNVNRELLSIIPDHKYVLFNSLRDITNKYGIYDGKYKYIYSSKEECIKNNFKDELYDLTNDPKENNNLINIQNTRAEELKKELIKRYPEINSITKPDAYQNLRSFGY